MLPDSGPALARLFHGALGLVFVVAFASLLAQLGPLWGSEGLSPIAGAVEAARAGPGADGLLAAPTLFRLSASDATLRAAGWLGALCGALALLGVRPRPAIAAATLLYLSFTSVGAPFLGFQWDSLLLECGLLALLLPRDRPAPVAHALLLCLWFKLYFESGVAKWCSPLGDWRDGSAMRFYYETAPLPGPLAWYAHHLPAWWHALESRLTLALELPLPLLAFCGRRGRLTAFAALTLFQLVNLATANYGFFVHLALALHLFLLRDADLLRLYARLPGLRRRACPPEHAPKASRVRAGLLAGFAAVYLGLSLLEARARFGDAPRARAIAAALQPYHTPLRLVNTYHLFAQITRERVEPELAGFDGATWRVYDLPWKPGPPERRPPLVAPHQPRLDFQLWFYGLRASRPPPAYVRRLLAALCEGPARVQPLFSSELLPAPTRVRIRFWRYTFSAPGEPTWWRREPVGPTREQACPRRPAP